MGYDATGKIANVKESTVEVLLKQLHSEVESFHMCENSCLWSWGQASTCQESMALHHFLWQRVCCCLLFVYPRLGGPKASRNPLSPLLISCSYRHLQPCPALHGCWRTERKSLDLYCLANTLFKMPSSQILQNTFAPLNCGVLYLVFCFTKSCIGWVHFLSLFFLLSEHHILSHLHRDVTRALQVHHAQKWTLTFFLQMWLHFVEIPFTLSSSGFP